MPDTTAIRLLHWDEAAASQCAVAVTTRHGGVSRTPYDTLNLALHVGDRPSDVAVNRARAAAAFGVDLGTTVFARQVHGAAAAFVDRGDRGRGSAVEDDAVPDVDILVTTSPDLTLVILVADCVPLALVDPTAGVLAAVHAGWRGTAAGAVSSALRAMAERGGRPDRVRAYLGPAVAPERYQVDAVVRHALADAVRPADLDPAVARADGPDHWRVDLVAANRQQLVGNGVRPEHIWASGVATHHEAFFSDRAARPCGRFGLMARLLG